MINLLPNMFNAGSEGHIGWFPARQQKLKELIKQLRPLNLIEIGFNMGHSCKLICDSILEIKKNNDNYQSEKINFYIFDICSCTYVESNFKILQDYYKDKNINIQLIKGSSFETVEPFMKNYNDIFDFIEIDGWHTSEAVKIDISNTYNKIKKGGIIYVDDYRSTEIPCHIEDGVDSFDWKEYDINNIDGLFWGIKK